LLLERDGGESGRWEEGTFSRAGSATVPLMPLIQDEDGKGGGGREASGGRRKLGDLYNLSNQARSCAAVPLIPSRRTKMGKEVEGGRQVEGGGNWEISVTSPTRLEVDPQLAQAARLTPRPESKT